MHVRALTKYLSLVLHPSFKTHYWQRAEWPEEWVDAAVKMVEKILLRDYVNTETVSSEPVASSSAPEALSMVSFRHVAQFS